MTLEKLKEIVEGKKFSDSPIIFKWRGNKFLPYQYINQIKVDKNLKLHQIPNLDEISFQNSCFDEILDELYIYDTDKLDCKIPNDAKNLIIVCKDVSGSVSQEIVEFDAPIDWQIESFVYTRLPGLSDTQIKWLCENGKYDIFRLNMECSKLEIFPKINQKIIFEEINDEDGYRDLNSLTIFNFTNAVMKKDLKVIKSIIKDIRYIDIEGSGLITIFHRQFKNLIDIQLNPRASAQSLNMNPKQFNAIKYNCGTYSDNQLINIFNFITKLDSRLKSGEFSFSGSDRENNAKFVDYITLNLIKLGNIK